jgi:hypothetical protein
MERLGALWWWRISTAEPSLAVAAEMEKEARMTALVLL